MKAIGELIKKYEKEKENHEKKAGETSHGDDYGCGYEEGSEKVCEEIIEDLTTLLSDIHNCPERGEDDVDHIEELEAKQEDEDGNPLPF